MSKKIAPTLQMWVNDENKRAWGNTDPRLPRVRAELRAVLSVVRAAKKVKPYSKDWQGRCEPIWNALDRLDRVGK